ncbi:hypothetical protein CDAR_468661 [Caerostris darwini]|uniref:Uncharacterized protein n=1 Tax=Caerostris darwini TaxID=1538125 RepID=A0AAV4SVV2_9ARAC|nr:hypothetical protein CDAR_468661 [Caerostris darwini]
MPQTIKDLDLSMNSRSPTSHFTPVQNSMKIEQTSTTSSPKGKKQKDNEFHDKDGFTRPPKYLIFNQKSVKTNSISSCERNSFFRLTVGFSCRESL